MKRPERVVTVLRKLSSETRKGRYRDAAVYGGPFAPGRSPFQELVACLISQRVRDETTTRVCSELFSVAQTPEEILALHPERLRRMLFGAGFYNQKAKQLRSLAQAVLDRGGVPETREGLLTLPGIGPKCANLVLASCFGEPVIAVDTHVHRISNRMDWVRTRAPEETEGALTKLVPKRWRARVNVLLVAHGQLVCRPIGPRCDECPVETWCRRRGVRPAGARRKGG